MNVMTVQHFKFQVIFKGLLSRKYPCIYTRVHVFTTIYILGKNAPSDVLQIPKEKHRMSCKFWFSMWSGPKNSDNTGKFVWRSGYIYICKCCFKIREDKHTEAINCTLLHTRIPAMSQQTQIILQQTNQKNFTGWKCTPATSWKKPRVLGQN